MSEHKHHSSERQDAPLSSGSVDMDSIFRDVLRQWWVILIVAIAFALFIGTFRQFMYRPKYSSTTAFVVTKNGVSSNSVADNLSAASSMTSALTTIIDSDILATRVCRDLQMDSLPGTISVNTVESSNLMSLSVTAGTPRMSYVLNLAVVNAARSLCREMMDDIGIQVIQSPVVPTYPSNPLDKRSSMRRGALLGAALMIALFAVLSHTRDSVKNEQQAQNKIDTRLLGTIYHENKKKTLKAYFKKDKTYSLLIDNPGLSFGYVEAVRMVATRIRRELDARHAQVLLITSVTENEGKSTVAANVALALAQEDKRVLLIDCDFRKPSQYKIFEEKADLEKIDFATSLVNSSKLYPRMAGLEKQLTVLFSTKARPHRLMNSQTGNNFRITLDHFRKSMDYIIIDTSPIGLVAETETIAGFCDAGLLVVEQDSVVSSHINDAIDRLNDSEAKIIGCIYNNVRRGFFGEAKTYGVGYGYGYGYGYGHYGHYGKYGKYGKYDKQGDTGNGN